MLEMSDLAEIRLSVPSRQALDLVTESPLPRGLRAGELSRSFYRDVYFDTADRTLEKRGVTCRVRLRSDDRRILSVELCDNAGQSGLVQSRQVYEAVVPESEPRGALLGGSDPARRLGAVVDPNRLRTSIEFEVERRSCRANHRWVPLRALDMIYDIVTVRVEDASESFYDVKIRHRRWARSEVEQLVQVLQDRYAARTSSANKLERAKKHLAALETRALTLQVQGSREVAVVACHGGKIALQRRGNSLAVPASIGSGEDACRQLLKDQLRIAAGAIRPLGTAAASVTRPLMEVWLADGLPGATEDPDDGRVQWFTLPEIMSRVGSPLIRDARTLAAIAVAARSDLSSGSAPGLDGSLLNNDRGSQVLVGGDGMQTIAELQQAELPEASLDADQPVPEQFINEELSWLEFNARVLEMAEDPGTPLLARLRFLAIFSSNLDEFYMIRIGGLKHDVIQGRTEKSLDGLTAEEQLHAVSIRVNPLVERQRLCADDLLSQLAAHGVRLVRWSDLDAAAREAMKLHFEQQIFPVLTPQAVTRAPGHPFPRINNLSLSLAVLLRDEEDGLVHVANVRMPAGLPRFVPLPGTKHLIPIEDIISANIADLYPERRVEHVFAFRITRSGDIHFDEEGAADLLRVVEEEVRRRPFGAVVRLEVDRAMPAEMRGLLERELQLEEAHGFVSLSDTDVFEIDGLVDLSGLCELAELPLASLDYPKFTARKVLDSGRSIFEQITENDILVHHPYDCFESTVGRFLIDAADDPAVIAIKLTLYRGGNQSSIVDALMRAARDGKEVSVFVELKARFDEERNIDWAKKLESAGIHVVYGLVRLKTHAKTTLVVRREGEEVRRYVHIGTGNYNAATSKYYVDLGMLSCKQKIGADLNDLFNELTGSSRPPQSKFRRLLVAPKRMKKRFLRLIEREADHALAGRDGRIRAKLNGLADRETIGALYRASQSGVEIDLIIRGICALRPKVPGLSDRIRVVSILGRFLEHARIYHFANGGEPEYFIGSADWRPRNLRRRVEVVAPVTEANACAHLDRILELELDDPYAWHMQSDGSYVRKPAPVGVDPTTAQEYWLDRLERDRV